MKQTLNGLRILNTRPKKQARALSIEINKAKGVAIECPTLEIEATDKGWVDSLPDLNTVGYAIFISANAVHLCFNQLKSKNISWPPNIKVIAIGKASAKALSTFNIRVDKMPDKSDSEHLIALNILQELKKQTVLLFKGEGGRALIEESLFQRGALVISINVYKRVLPTFSPQLIASIWRDNLVDIILLTCEQSIYHIFKMFGQEAHSWLKEKPCVVISERLAKIAASFGMEKIIISHPEKMMNTLFDSYQGILHGQ